MPPRPKEKMQGLELWKCGGDTIESLFDSGLFDDEKTVVDMPLSPECPSVLSLEQAIRTAVTREREKSGHGPTIQEVISRYFLPAESDLVPSVPSDFSPSPPPFLSKIFDPRMRALGASVHSLWPSLCFSVRGEAREKPWRHSLLPVPHPFFVPGQRFREMYYWDSYWIVRGLLASRMKLSARHVACNLMHMLRASVGGFVPNGSRTYYRNRSQPPLLSEILRALLDDAQQAVSERSTTGQEARQVKQGELFKSGVEHCQSPPMEPQEVTHQAVLELLHEALPLLLEEHTFWTTPPHSLRVRDPKSGRIFALSRYYARWAQPRPESHCKDVEAARGVEDNQKPEVYREFATVAESGWDFSSRWMRDPGVLASSCPTRVLPCDLNAFLFRMESNVALFAEALNEKRLCSCLSSHGDVDAGSSSQSVMVSEKKDATGTRVHSAGVSEKATRGDGSKSDETPCWHLEVRRRFKQEAASRQEAIQTLMWVQWDKSQLPSDSAAHVAESRSDGDTFAEISALHGRWQDVWVQKPEEESSDSAAEEAADAIWEVTPRPWPGVPGGTGNDLGITEGILNTGGIGSAVGAQLPVYASDFIPLWCGLLPPGDPKVEAVARAFSCSGLLQEAGVAASNLRTGEQWDFPNAWPPLQHALRGLCIRGSHLPCCLVPGSCHPPALFMLCSCSMGANRIYA